MTQSCIGMRFAVFTKTEYTQGQIPAPNTRSQTVSTGVGSREFVVVKFSTSSQVTYINGSLITIAGDGTATIGTTTAHGTLVAGGRAGILNIVATATTVATQTVTGTCFGWAQIYGLGAVRTATISVANAMLAIGADGVAVLAAVGSASAQLSGIVGTTTSSAAGLLPCLLQYPQFQGTPA